MTMQEPNWDPGWVILIQQLENSWNVRPCLGHVGQFGADSPNPCHHFSDVFTSRFAQRRATAPPLMALWISSIEGLRQTLARTPSWMEKPTGIIQVLNGDLTAKHFKNTVRLNGISWGYHWDMTDWLLIFRHPSVKYEWKSVGMMTFPTEWKVINSCSKPPTRIFQRLAGKLTRGKG